MTGPAFCIFVEDDRASFLYFHHLMEKTGAVIAHAETGAQAWELFFSGKFDLVLMDVRLGDTNGLHLARKIRRHNRHTPIIAQTAYALSTDKDRCLQAGCNDYITKPIQPLAFMEKIDAFLNGPDTPPGQLN